MKGEDKDRIESLTKALGEVSGKMAERLYAQNQGGPAGPRRARVRPRQRPGRRLPAARTTWSMPSSKRSRTAGNKRYCQLQAALRGSSGMSVKVAKQRPRFKGWTGGDFFALAPRLPAANPPPAANRH